MKKRTHARSHRFRIIHLNTPVRKQNSVKCGCIGTSYNRAEITRVAYTVAKNIHSVLFRRKLFFFFFYDGKYPLRRFCIRKPVRQLLRHNINNIITYTVCQITLFVAYNNGTYGFTGHKSLVYRLYALNHVFSAFLPALFRKK